MKMSLLRSSLLVLVLLCGCGGGSDSKISASLNPTAIKATYYKSNAQTFTVNATVRTSGDINGTVYILIVDPTQLLQSFTVIQAADGTYSATLVTSTATDPGHYQGTFQIRFCDSQTCSTQYGSASLGYDFTVLSDTNLTPLTALPGATDWAMYQGNAQHTGIVPAALDATKFSVRWIWQNPTRSLSDPPTFIYPPIVAAGQVYLTFNRYVDYNGMYALNEQDASVAWTNADAFQGQTLYAPAIDGGTIFFIAQGTNTLTRFDVDASTGAISKMSNSTKSGSAIPFTITGGRIFIPDDQGIEGLLEIIETTPIGVPISLPSTGPGPIFNLPSFDWRATISDAASNVAVLNNQAFNFSPAAGLNILDANSGGISQTLPVAADNFGAQPVVINSNPDVLVNGLDQLMLFATAQSQLKWSVGGSFVGTPVDLDGVVYIEASNPTQMEALDETDGHLLWTWTPPSASEQPFNGNMVLANNMVFLSTDQNVYAIDTSTHASVWSYDRPGLMAVSANGVLYIVSGKSAGGPPYYGEIGSVISDGYVTAVNLH